MALTAAQLAALSPAGFQKNQARFDQLAAELRAAGILEHGFRKPTHVICPECLEDTKVQYTLEAQTVACTQLVAGDKKGCGASFALRAATPMHSIGWDPTDWTPRCLRVTWHHDVAADHPARATYRELRNNFLADIGIELN